MFLAFFLTLTLGTSFFRSLQKTPLLCLRMEEARPGAPGAASRSSFNQDTRESWGSDVVTKEEIPPVPRTPFCELLRLGANSGSGDRVQERGSEPPDCKQ